MKKNILIYMAMLLSFAFVAYGASESTVNLDTPANNANINGSYNFTATITYGDAIFNTSNCTFSTTTDGVFGTTIVANATTYYNYSDTSTTTTETASTTITVTCYNRSNSASITDTSTTITIDNTDPTCDCSLDREFVEKGEEIDYDCTDSSDTSTITYSCVATYDDATTETETDGNGFFSDTFSLGDVSISCTVTDEVSKTNTCSTLTARISSGDGTVPPDKKVEEDKNTALIVIILIVIVVAIASIIAVMSSKPKRRRKR